MIIGTLDIELNIDHAQSLKDKRAVLSRIKDRVHNKFNVSIAEVDGYEVWNYACLGVAIVSNDQKHCNRVLDKVLLYVEEIGDCVVSDYGREFINLG